MVNIEKNIYPPIILHYMVSTRQVSFNYAPINQGNYLISESRLPTDWEDSVRNGFSRQAKFYSEGITNDTPHNKTNLMIDNIISELIAEQEYTSIADIGVGDGIRLKRIFESAQRLNPALFNSEIRLFGTELSDDMIREATNQGVTTIKHNMIEPLPFLDDSLDMIMYLSGDFGYLMDPNQTLGRQKRIDALNSAYDKLKKNGTLVLDMHCLDDLPDNISQTVMAYKREVRINGEHKTELDGNFYLMYYRLRDIVDLLKHSKWMNQLINQGSSNFGELDSGIQIRYILLGQGTEEKRPSGTIVQEYSDFTQFRQSDIISPEQVGRDTNEYKLLITLKKI